MREFIKLIIVGIASFAVSWAIGWELGKLTVFITYSVGSLL